MAGRHFIVEIGHPATHEQDVISHHPFLPGERAIDCGNQHYFHADSWQKVNEKCPLDRPGITSTKKDLSVGLSIVVFLVAFVIVIAVLLLLVACGIGVAVPVIIGAQQTQFAISTQQANLKPEQTPPAILSPQATLITQQTRTAIPGQSATSSAQPTPTLTIVPQTTLLAQQTQSAFSAQTATLSAQQTRTAGVLTQAAVSPPTVSVPSINYSSLVNVRNGLCLAIFTNPGKTGSAVIQDFCTGEANQQWQVVPLDSQYSQIRLRYSGMCLDIDGKAAEDDGIIQQDCNRNRDTQSWQLKNYPAGNFEIIGAHGGLCMDVPGFQNAPKIQIIYFTCNPIKNENDNQRWVRR